MHVNEPYPPEMAGFLKKIKKAVKRAFTPPKHIRKAFKKAIRPLAHWKMKDVTKAFKKAFVVPHKVRKMYNERGILDAFEMWLETEVDPIAKKFGEGKTFITPTDVLLAPLSLLVPGSGAAVSAGLKASVDVAAKVGFKAAAWHAVKTAAIKLAPDIAGEAIITGMDFVKAKKLEEDMKKLARRAEREEAIATAEYVAAEEAAVREEAAIVVEERALPFVTEAIAFRKAPPAEKPFPWMIPAAAVGALLLFKVLEDR